MKRRTFIHSGVTAGLTVSLAGCTTDSDNPENNINTSPPESSETSTETEADTETETEGETETETETETNDGSSDTEGPVIDDFSISGNQFSSGEAMEINVEVSDQNEISRLYFRFENEAGGGAVYDAYRDFSPPVDSGTYTIEYQWPEDTPGGTYEATWIHAEDDLGNTADWTDSFSTEKKQITINSEVSDTEGPVIQDFTISADQFEPGETMQIEADVTDETDIARVYFRFEHEDGGGAVYDAYRDFSPAVESGTYTIEYQWPEDTPTGTYQATWIYAEDSIGNTATWTDSFSTQKKQIEIRE